MKLQNLLVPVDFSNESYFAVDMAVQLGTLTNAKVYLLHIYSPSVIEILSDKEMYMESYEQTFSSQIHKKFDKIKQAHSNAEIVSNLLAGNVHQEILNFAYENNIDLIVMGSKGSSGLDEVIIGSNTEKIVRYSKIPVLTVKESPKTVGINNMVFASNFEFIPEDVIDDLKTFQSIFEAKLHFVKIITPSSFEYTPETITNIELFAEENNFQNYSVNFYNHATVEEGIRAFGNYAKADMLVLATYGRSGLIHQLFDSVAESVANHARLPILTFNLSK